MPKYGNCFMHWACIEPLMKVYPMAVGSGLTPTLQLPVPFVMFCVHQCRLLHTKRKDKLYHDLTTDVYLIVYSHNFVVDETLQRQIKSNKPCGEE